MSAVPVAVSLIVARAENGVIGADGKLPWHISADLQHFKKLTVGKPIIMGRKTYDSIGRPLPRRTNIVVTRTPGWQAEGVQVAPDLPTAFALAFEDALRTGADEAMVIGGSTLYEQSLPHAQRVYLTEVHRAYAGDTKFDIAISAPWHETAREDHVAEGDQPAYSFVTWEKGGRRMIKMIYLTKRKSSFTPDQFTIRWRMHGAKGMSTAFWRHALLYVHAETVRPVFISGASDAYDGVAILTTKDDAYSGEQTPQDQKDTEMMLKDEFETFAGPITPVSLFLNDESLKDGEPGGDTAYMFFLDSAKARQTAEAYRTSEQASRVVLNTRRGDMQFPGFGTDIPYQAVVEVSATSLKTLKAIVEPVLKSGVPKADVMVVTREAVMWDRLSAA